MSFTSPHTNTTNNGKVSVYFILFYFIALSVMRIDRHSLLGRRYYWWTGLVNHQPHVCYHSPNELFTATADFFCFFLYFLYFLAVRPSEDIYHISGLFILNRIIVGTLVLLCTLSHFITNTMWICSRKQ